MQIVDYSYTQQDPNKVKAYGYVAVMRYLGGDGRCISVIERDILFGAGLRIGMIGQEQVQRPLSGYSGGWEDAATYNWWASALGAPMWKPILYVCDIGRTEGGRSYGPTKGLAFPTQAQHGKILDYFHGILDRTKQEGWRPVGAYGPYSIIELLRPLPLFCYWEAAGDQLNVMGTGTGGSIHNIGDGPGVVRKVSSLACMYQMYGGDVLPGTDHNVVLKPEMLGAFTWHPNDNNDPGDEMATCKILSTAVGSKWGKEVAGYGVEGQAEYLAYPGSGIIKWIHSKDQLDMLHRLGIEHQFDVPDDIFYLYTLMADDSRPQETTAAV